MKSMVTISRLMRLADDSSGATAVEYALIVSAIAGIIAAVVYVLGAKTNNLYNNVRATSCVASERTAARSVRRASVGG